MKTYYAKLRHDHGTVRMRIRAFNRAGALDALMAAEGCPNRSIVKITEEKRRTEKISQSE